MPDIDWSELGSESTCYCRCGQIYRSRNKIKQDDDGLNVYTELPCPKCGETKNHLRRVSDDPIIM